MLHLNVMIHRLGVQIWMGNPPRMISMNYTHKQIPTNIQMIMDFQFSPLQQYYCRNDRKFVPLS